MKSNIVGGNLPAADFQFTSVCQTLQQKQAAVWTLSHRLHLTSSGCNVWQPSPLKRQPWHLILAHLCHYIVCCSFPAVRKARKTHNCMCTRGTQSKLACLRQAECLWLKSWRVGHTAGKARVELGLPERARAQRLTPPPAEEPVSNPDPGRKQKRLSTWLDQRKKYERHCSAALSTTWKVVLHSCLFWCSVSSLLGGVQTIGAAATGSTASPLGFAGPPQGRWLSHTTAHKRSDWWRLEVAQCLSWRILGMSSEWT